MDLTTLKNKLFAWAKRFYRQSLPIIDRVMWVLFPPYGIYIAFRHVRENWDSYQDMAESGALLLAERAGYSDEEQEEMLVAMKERRKEKELAKELKRKKKLEKKKK